MKRLKWLFYGAVGVLLVVGLLLSIGQSENDSYPLVSDYGPEGLAVFHELLVQSGREVVTDRNSTPKTSKGDLVIVPNWSRQIEVKPDRKSAAQSDPAARYLRGLHRFVDGGGTVVFLTFGEENPANKATQKVEAAWGGTYEVTPFSEAYDTEKIFIGKPEESVPILAGDGHDISGRMLRFKEGRVFYIRSGSFLNNRNIDKASNAALAMDLVEAASSKGRIVVSESLIAGPEQKGLLGKLGNWAVAARWQVLLLVAAMIIASTVIFGPPRGETFRVRSSRDLVDAVADVLKRGRKYYEIAFREREDARRRIVRVLGTDPRAEWGTIAKLVPAELRDVMNTMHGNIRNESELLALTHRLHHELDAFESDSRQDRPA